MTGRLVDFLGLGDMLRERGASVPQHIADMAPRTAARVGHMIPLDTEAERATIHRMRKAAEAWLLAQGEDQFQPDTATQARHAHQIINRLFDAGAFVGLQVAGRLVAVGAITSPDPDFWTVEERGQPQIYIGRFLAEHGHGYGRELLRQVAATGVLEDTPRLRLDCWRTNQRLQDYYRRLGFQHLRTVPVDGRGSGALFELDLSVPSPLLP